MHVIDQNWLLMDNPKSKKLNLHNGVQNIFLTCTATGLGTSSVAALLKLPNWEE